MQIPVAAINCGETSCYLFLLPTSSDILYHLYKMYVFVLFVKHNIESV